MKPKETDLLNTKKYNSICLVSNIYRRQVKLKKPTETKSEQKLLFSKIQKSNSNAFVLEKVSWFSLSIYIPKPETNFLMYILENTFRGLNHAY